jgi:hypothetical protein
MVIAVYRHSAESSRRQSVLEQEFQHARTVQQVLIPEAIPPVPGFSINSVYKPAGEVGGDFFQILPTEGDGHRIAFSVFTVDNPGFDRMQFQITLRQARLKTSLEGFGFLLSPAVNQSVICIPTPKQVGIGPLHPQVERVVKE